METKTSTAIFIFIFLFFFSSISYSFTGDADKWVNAHNKYRRLHVNTDDVIWSSALATKAQDWADTCIWGHSETGENMGQGYANPDDMLKGWYEEEYNNYVKHGGYQNPPFDIYAYGADDIGHFTQVVWKSTKQIGCGYNSSCGHIVCKYSPSGNVSGQFGANVMPRKILRVDPRILPGPGGQKPKDIKKFDPSQMKPRF